MSWLFSQALVEEYLGDTCLDGEPSAQLNGNPTQQAYCAPDKMTKFSRLSRFGMTYKPLTESRGEELLTLYLEDFHARTSAQPEKVQELQAADQECGNIWLASLAKYDHSTSMWKTAQCSLLEDSMSFSLTLPRWGLMQNGALYPQQTLVQTIKENESGLWPTSNTLEGLAPKKLDRIMEYNNKSRPGRSYASMNLREQVVYGKIPIWPTPTASKGGSWRSDGQIAMVANTAATYQEYLMLTKGSCKSKLDKYWPTPQARDHKGSSGRSNKNQELDLPTKVKLWPTPTANEDVCGKPTGKMQKMLGNHPEVRQDPNGGTLNPTWVEWLMGWPLGWTDLKPLEMDKYHKWLEQHGVCLNKKL